MRKRRGTPERHRARRRQAVQEAPRAGANGHVSHDAKVVALVTPPSPEACVTAAIAANRCAKCRSTFVMREPAFLHCHYCGAMTRIPNGSLLEQELFELRSGLRLAS